MINYVRDASWHNTGLKYRPITIFWHCSYDPI